MKLGQRSYEILITSDQWAALPARLMSELGDLTHAMIVADEAVWERFAQPLADSLSRECRCDLTRVPAGESSKSIECLASLWQWMHQCDADRKSVLIAIGGGVVGDLAGFAAASFARGIRLVQVPTTLLAMVDSSVGGKTGINLPSGKNMVGAFWQPSLVVIDTQALDTLPYPTFVSGLAEVIKYGVIEDADFFAWLEQNAAPLADRQNDAIRHAIARSCEIKASVVADDERETSGRRAILNYGHTFAHAIEATAGYGTMLHGEAVAVGMEMAARMAHSLGRVDVQMIDRQRDLIRRCNLPTVWADADPDAMLRVMRTDKKVAHGKLRFVLPSRIGHVDLVTCDDVDVIAAAIRATRYDFDTTV